VTQEQALDLAARNTPPDCPLAGMAHEAHRLIDAERKDCFNGCAMNLSQETKTELEKVCPVVLNLNPEAGYFSVLDCPDGRVRLYYRGKGRSRETHVRESKNGIIFSRPRVVLTGSFICHNFSPFIHGGKLYAVGGKCRFNNERKKKHGDGLYLLRSADGRSWNLVRDEPILTPSHPGYHRASFDLREEFDSSISCVPYQNRFYLYFRANLERGVRGIQYAVSDNLLDWSEIRPVQFRPACDPRRKDNFYGPYFFGFEGLVKGMIPCFRNDGEGFIGLFEPDDELAVWNFAGWFNRAPVVPPNNKNRSFPVQGMIRNRRSPERLHYYVHENYLKRVPGEPVTLDLYMHRDHLESKTGRPLLRQHPEIVFLRLCGYLLRLCTKAAFLFKRGRAS
jgi:hypothetical protein